MSTPNKPKPATPNKTCCMRPVVRPTQPVRPVTRPVTPRAQPVRPR